MHPTNCPGPLRWHTALVSPDLIEKPYIYTGFLHGDPNFNGFTAIPI